jgi:hypothetical protein
MSVQLQGGVKGLDYLEMYLVGWKIYRIFKTEFLILESTELELRPSKGALAECKITVGSNNKN